MLFVFNKYTDNIRKLRKTVQNMNFDAEIVVLGDSGFLPDGISSPYDHFIYKQHNEELKERELYYDFLGVPEFWEIRSSGIQGAVYDMNCKKADIYFSDPMEKRNVQRVEWCMESGWVYKIDYYNKYALKYASEFLDVDGNVESKVFYSSRNQEIIVEQPANDVVTLLENGIVKAQFTSYAEFVEFYLHEIGNGEKWVLFVQDEESFGVLDFKSGKNAMWEYVLFSNQELLDKYISMGGEKGYCFYDIPEEYPCNNAGGEVLILTTTDQLEGIEYLVQELSEVVFYIAANTQVSDKLYELGKRTNVEVYPQISAQDLEVLWNRCSFYLDINYYWEFQNAIETAYQRNLLIMGFEDTLHHRELVAEECIFSQLDVGKLALALKGYINHVELVQKRLEQQQKKKGILWERLRGAV